MLPSNGIYVYSICPLFLLFLVVVAYDGPAVTSAQQLPVPTAEAREDKSREHNQQHKRPHWLPKIAHHLGGLATADSNHLFSWFQPTKHLASLFTAEVDDDTEPDMAGSVSSMNRWKANNWRPPGPSKNQHQHYNSLFDDSNNYLHEFFAAETQQQRPKQQRPHRQFVRTQQHQQQRKHRPPPMMFSRRPMMISHPRPPMMMMNHGGGNRHHHQQNHHHQNYHHQNYHHQNPHSFQGMQMLSFMHQNQQYQQQHHQQQNLMFPPMNFMHPPGYISNSGGGGGFEEGSEGNPIKGAVISHHHEQQVFNVPGQFQQQQQYGEPTMVHIEGNVYPITLSWNTFSSPMMEGHQDSEGAYSSHAELVSHTHHKPIYREVHQMVSGSPYHHDNWNYHQQHHQMGHHQNSGGDHHHYHQQQPPPPPHQLYHRRSSQETTSGDDDSRTHEHHQSHHTSKKPPPPIEKKIGKS